MYLPYYILWVLFTHVYPHNLNHVIKSWQQQKIEWLVMITHSIHNVLDSISVLILSVHNLCIIYNFLKATVSCKAGIYETFQCNSINGLSGDGIFGLFIYTQNTWVTEIETDAMLVLSLQRGKINDLLPAIP